MVPRETPRHNPRHRPYVTIEVPDLGAHVVRIPSMLQLSKLMRAMEDHHFAVALGIGKISSERELGMLDMLSAMREAGPEFASVLAALIGLAWHHEALDLESVRGDNLLEYGEALFEELYSAGYALEHFLVLGVGILAEALDQNQLRQEVQDKALFFLQKRAGMLSPRSTPASATSETPEVASA